MPVYGVVGFPGSGKTYRLVEVGLEARRRGSRVVANFRLGRWGRPLMDDGTRGERAFLPYRDVGLLSGWDELMEVRAEKRGGRLVGPRIVVLLDELNLWAPSRMWQALPVGLLYKWSHSRKHGLEIWWSAQHESRVDTVVREVTELVYSCKRMGPSRRPVGFLRRSWLPDEVGRSRKGRGMEWSLFRHDIADAFDTYEDVELAAHLRKDRKARSI